MAPSWRRAREYSERALAIGCSTAAADLAVITGNIATVRVVQVARLALASVTFIPDLHLHASQLAPLMDQRVEIHGTSRADMNGKCGVATDMNPGSSCCGRMLQLHRAPTARLFRKSSFFARARVSSSRFRLLASYRSLD